MSPSPHPHLYASVPFSAKRFWELYTKFLLDDKLTTGEAEELESHSKQFDGTTFELINLAKDWSKVVGLVCFVSCDYGNSRNFISIDKGDVGILHPQTDEIYWVTSVVRHRPMSRDVVNSIKGVHLPLFTKPHSLLMIQRQHDRRYQRSSKLMHEAFRGTLPIHV